MHIFRKLLYLCSFCNYHLKRQRTMALITCKECGGQISNQATVCPHCGCPQTPVSEDSLVGEDRMDSAVNLKLGLTVVVIVLFVIGLVATCPSTEKHEEAIEKTCTEVVDKVVEKENNILVSGLTSMFGGRIAGVLVKSMLTVDNYFFFSVGKIKIPTEAEPRVATIGVLGHVFVLASADEISEKLKD